MIYLVNEPKTLECENNLKYDETYLRLNLKHTNEVRSLIRISIDYIRKN